MMLSTLAFVLAAAAAPDTTIILATTSRDLTADGRPEQLTLTAVGKSIDDLKVTLTIKSGDRLLYSAPFFPLSRKKYEQTKRPGPSVGYDAWVRDAGVPVFLPRKFLAPSEFVEELTANAREHVALIPSVIARAGFADDTVRAAKVWTEIQRSGVTTFEYSPGGDNFTVIAWHAATGRFYRLVDCC